MSDIPSRLQKITTADVKSFAGDYFQCARCKKIWHKSQKRKAMNKNLILIKICGKCDDEIRIIDFEKKIKS